MVGGMVNDTIEGKSRTTKQYLGVWGQNIVGGAEIGASFDAALISGGTGLVASGALGGAGANALTFYGQGAESVKDFAASQAEGAAYGAAGGVVLSKLAPLAGRLSTAITERTGQFGVALRETAQLVKDKVAAVSAKAIDSATSRYVKTEADSLIAKADTKLASLGESVRNVLTGEGRKLETSSTLSPAAQRSVAAEVPAAAPPAQAIAPPAPAVASPTQRPAQTELTPFTQRYLAGSGGRWGTTATRQQNYEIAQELHRRGYSFGRRPGGGVGPEEYIRGTGPGTKGSTYVDITATAPNGRTVRIQTVTTERDGVTPTLEELAAAARIRAAFPKDKLILVPKRQ
jgi:hypothetical protein